MKSSPYKITRRDTFGLPREVAEIETCRPSAYWPPAFQVKRPRTTIPPAEGTGGEVANQFLELGMLG